MPDALTRLPVALARVPDALTRLPVALARVTHARRVGSGRI